MDIERSTRSYEQWLARRTPLLSQDMCARHSAMAQSAFAFFRATFYRWVQLWPEGMEKDEALGRRRRQLPR